MSSGWRRADTVNMTIRPLGRSTLLVGLALVACFVVIPNARQRGTPSPDANASAERDQIVVRVLRSVLGPPDSDFQPYGPTRYTVAFADLNGDGRVEALAYISGGDWCGSGGCKLMVLTPVADSYRVVGDTTITR